MSDDVEVLKAMVHDLALERPDRMTLLDQFAQYAMTALIANKAHWNGNDDGGSMDEYAERLAFDSYMIATEMLKSRSQAMKGEM